MNKHMVILPALLIAATSLLLLSLSLPEDSTGPEVIASATPTPSAVASGQPSAQASATAAAQASAEPGASPEPSAKPTPTPTPEPSPTASAADTFGIAATSPAAVLREAQLHAGRMDPFKSMFPPSLPEFESAISPEQLALPQLMLPPDAEAAIPVVATPRPAPTPAANLVPVLAPLEQGLSLKGLIDGGIDPIALIEVNGTTEMVRVGERLPGNILVTSIHFEQKRVTLSRGQQKGTLILPTPKTPSY